MLDAATLQVAFAVIASTLLVLFYGVSVRRDHSGYSKWWCVAIACFLTGTGLYLLDGTSQQIWANPAGNALLVSGATCIWSGVRVLRTSAARPLFLLAAPAVTAFASALDNPSGNTWAGGGVLLGFMALFMGLASMEAWRLDPGVTSTKQPLGIASGALGLYYLCRWIVFLLSGPTSPTFETYFGTVPTTLITMVLLIVVAFTMSTLSTEQALQELKSRASHDDLTTVLNRRGFIDLASAEIRRLRVRNTPCTLIMADLDNFKWINDSHGHPAGDKVLQAFAQASSRSIRSTDLVGRYGGEEFIFLLPGAGLDTAELIAGLISRTLRSAQPAFTFPLPTVSYGVASLTPGPNPLQAMITAADSALYDAKEAGKNCVVRATQP